MRIRDVESKPGRMWSLEVSGWIGRQRLVRLVAAIPSVRVLRQPKLFSALREDVFCRFEFAGRTFEIDAFLENAYCISPMPAGCVPELLMLRAALRQSLG
jgi:hypothetical protein